MKRSVSVYYLRNTIGIQLYSAANAANDLSSLNLARTRSVTPLSRVRPSIPLAFICVFYKNLCISDLSRINLKTFKLSSCSASRMTGKF